MFKTNLEILPFIGVVEEAMLIVLKHFWSKIFQRLFVKFHDFDRISAFSYGNQIDVTLKNRLGDQPIHLAAKKGSRGCIELLRSTNKVDIFAKDSDGQKPYDLANDVDAKAAIKLWMNEIDRNIENDDDYEQSDED